ncbi:hypothetical protein [Hymenobacter persicinus]|uniref:Uncharacterized protein n=1 Tax=Hymenobacter persicinus TaxID=2025506 RepID=A0A4Q5LF39_9BACT|nr:hypothetical protein [Hymenobacter persicinus]RYU83336.1 hypothetical protein EWM57_03350 [Hymenobacter persicinus]
MPKTIEYPRTSYLSAWEVAEVVDDTGGKCAIETCARKLSRKVSGSFKAIIGSAVKFGLVTSKRELLTTTNLFRRIKHAYDKQEEKVFHREAFLHPPLFTQICRKFRNRELPVHMFDVMLIREFGVEEINAQNVAKAFVDGARMVGILDERNVIADIDALAAQQTPRRELASTEMPANLFKPAATETPASTATGAPVAAAAPVGSPRSEANGAVASVPAAAQPLRGKDAVSSLFGLDTDDLDDSADDYVTEFVPSGASTGPEMVDRSPAVYNSAPFSAPTPPAVPTAAVGPSKPLGAVVPAHSGSSYALSISGPGIDTQLIIQDQDDLAIVSILLEKIRRQLAQAG